MKRVFALLFASIMMFSFTACDGGNKKEEVSKEVAQQDETQSEEKEMEPVKKDAENIFLYSATEFREKFNAFSKESDMTEYSEPVDTGEKYIYVSTIHESSIIVYENKENNKIDLIEIIKPDDMTELNYAMSCFLIFEFIEPARAKDIGADMITKIKEGIQNNTTKKISLLSQSTLYLFQHGEVIGEEAWYLDIMPIPDGKTYSEPTWTELE